MRNTFAGNGYQFGGGDIVPRYVPTKHGIRMTNEGNNSRFQPFVNCIFYACRQYRLNQYPMNDPRNRPKCQSDNFISPTGGLERQQYKTCEECPLKDFKEIHGRKQQPECLEVIEVMGYDLTHNQMFITHWKSRSYKIWKNTEKAAVSAVWSMKDFDREKIHPMICSVFKLSVEHRKENNTEYSVFKTEIVGEVKDKGKHQQIAEQSYNFLLCGVQNVLQLESNEQGEKKLIEQPQKSENVQPQPKQLTSPPPQKPQEKQRDTKPKSTKNLQNEKVRELNEEIPEEAEFYVRDVQTHQVETNNGIAIDKPPL